MRQRRQFRTRLGVCRASAWKNHGAQQVIQTNNTRTIADGIAVRVPVPEALQAMQSVVDDIWLIEDEDLLTAMRLAHKTLGIVTEPAGVAGLAAILKDRDQLSGQSVATVLCGGNLTDEQRRLWLC